MSPDRTDVLPFRPRVPQALLPAALALVLSACGDGATDPAARPRTGPIDLALPWQTAAPASLGVDPALLDGAVAGARDLERVQSLLVVRQGRLVLEEYFDGFGRDDPADVRSVTKSVVSVLTGIALARGDLPGLDATLADLVPASVAAVPEAQRGITLRHLLTMSGGWTWDESTPAGYNEWVSSNDKVAYLLARPLAHEPGTRFTYNSAAVHLLGVILQEAVGPLPDYARLHLWDPVGAGPVVWEPVGGGRVNGGSGIDVRPRDLARLGQLMLQEGRSGDRQVVPADWVAATAAPAGWTGSAGSTLISYGYLWWTDEGRDGFFAWGHGGQFVYVSPPRDLVVVATTRWRPRGGEPSPPNIAIPVLELIVRQVVPAAPPL